MVSIDACRYGVSSWRVLFRPASTWEPSLFSSLNSIAVWVQATPLILDSLALGRVKQHLSGGSRNGSLPVHAMCAQVANGWLQTLYLFISLLSSCFLYQASHINWQLITSRFDFLSGLDALRLDFLSDPDPLIFYQLDIRILYPLTHFATYWAFEAFPTWTMIGLVPLLVA